MIRNKQEIESFRYPNKQGVNLAVLKSQIDHKFLRITMLINNINPLGQQGANVFTNKQHFTDRAVQTYGNQNKLDQSNHKRQSRLREGESCNQKSKAQSSEASNNILAQKLNNAVSTSIMSSHEEQSYSMKKNKEICHAEAVSQINLQLSKLENISQFSPIRFIKFSKTDRTQKSFVKKVQQQPRIAVSSESITKLQAEINLTKTKCRRQVTDPKVRLNLLKKIEQKFQPNLQKQKNH